MKAIQPTLRIRDGLLSIVSLALAGLFLATGLGKVVGYSEMVEDFARWGYPSWLVIVASSLEITGALLILAPRLATVGAALIATSMMGAFLTHVANGQPAKMVLTGLLLIAALSVAAVRWSRSIHRTDVVRSSAQTSASSSS